MKLRNKNSIITNGAEGLASRSLGSRVTQKVYLLVLLSLILYLIYIAVSRMFYIDERGLIEIERTQISATKAGKIIKMPVVEGQRVKKNDLLVRIKAAGNDCLERSNNRHDRLSLDLQENIDKRVLLKHQLKEKKKLVAQETLRRALEVEYGHVAQRQKLELAVQSLQFEINLLSSEIQQQKKRLKSIKRQRYSRRNCQIEDILAPKDGVVHALILGRYEVASSGDPIMSFVSDDARVYVETYINDDNLERLTAGKSAVILLPNKEESGAVIESVRSSAVLREEREWDQYMPVKTKLLLRLTPESEQQALLWKKYDRMNIKVSIQK